MGIQDLLNRVIGFHIPSPAVELDKEDQIQFSGFHILQKLQYHLALSDGFPGGITLIPVDANDFAAVLLRILDQVVFLGLQRIAVHGLFFGGNTDVEGRPQDPTGGIF